MRLQAVLLVAVVLAPASATIAADTLDESRAVREIERLGGIVSRDEALPGCPVTAVRFKRGSEFADDDVPLLKPFAQLATLDLGNTKICGTRIVNSGLKGLRDLKKLTTLNLSGAAITDDSLNQLGELHNLTTLTLDHTQITDAGLQQLLGLKNLAILSPMDGLTDADLKRLRHEEVSKPVKCSEQTS